MADPAPVSTVSKDGESKDSAPLSLSQYRKMFERALYDMLDARTDSELSRDFYDSKQLTKPEAALLKRRKQPPVVINLIQRAIDGIMGIIGGNKTDPRALMRNPPDDSQRPTPPQPMPGMGAPQPGQQVMGGNGGPAMTPEKPDLDAGDVATMALRYINDTTHFADTTKMDVLENGLIEGCGAAIVEIDGRMNVAVTQIRWEEFFFDPKSRRYDFKDARFLGIAKWMYSDDLAALYPQMSDDIKAFQNDGGVAFGLDQTFLDRPETLTPWVDQKDRRMMVVDLYHMVGGKWWRCVFYAGAILECAPSAYTDDFGDSCCPIEGWSAYIDRENQRYGLVKSMRDPQREINMRRSKAIHEINTRQIQQTDPNAPPVDTKTARDEAARPDGVVPTGWQIVPRNDVVANNIEMLSIAKTELERLGAAPSVLARQGADASGRSQQIRQQIAVSELSRVLGRHGEWETRIYTQMWWRARQFWTDPKWIRVTNDNQAPQYVRVNEPLPPDPMTGQPPIDPKTGQPIVKNHVAQMDVDIVLDKVPDTATLEQEIFAELAQLAQSYGPQAVPFSVMLELSSISKKREVLDKLEAYQAQNAPIAQAQQQGAMAKMAADIELIKSTINKNNAAANLSEAQTVTTALAGHLQVTQAAQLPPGVTVDNSGTPQHVMPPPHPIPQPPMPPAINGGPPQG